MCSTREDTRRRLALLERLVNSDDPDEAAALELLEDDLKEIASKHRADEWGYRHRMLDHQRDQEEAERNGDEKTAEEQSHLKFDNERRAEIQKKAAEIAEEIIRIIHDEEEEQEGEE